MKRISLIISLVSALSLCASLSSAAYATSDHDPAGNNGFVKINNEVMPDNIPQNHPHVSCNFSVEFYDYDQNNSYATVDFELQAPTNRSGDSLQVTSGNLHPFIGADAVGGGKDLDARENYTLSFTGTPQQNQGYHVKLTVDAPGSKGSGKKQKVFWVQPCTEASTTTTSPQVLGSTTTAPSAALSETTAGSTLPNTGPGNAVGLFFGVSTVGAFAHHLWRRHKLRVSA